MAKLPGMGRKSMIPDTEGRSNNYQFGLILFNEAQYTNLHNSGKLFK